MEIQLIDQNRTADVEILARKGNIYQIRVDKLIYEVDLVKLDEGIYSLLLDGRSYNVEAIREGNSKRYTVNTFYNTFEVEIQDAETRYMKARNTGSGHDKSNEIRVPMPGKVVDVLVKTGDPVEAGQTLVTVSAMKMESEYKSGKQSVVKEILVKAGDTVDSDQIMIILE